jgi:hypothetical protein
MNVLLIMADELSTWGLGCSGSVIPRTPHLDALAARGTQFEAAMRAQALLRGSDCGCEAAEAFIILRQIRLDGEG